MANALDFLNGFGDVHGRTVNDLLAWEDEDWEYVHDFIQWAFPLTEKSSFVPDSPVVSEDQISTIRSSKPCQRNLRRLQHRYQSFLERTDSWLSDEDHNHVRIIRVLRSLDLLAQKGSTDFRMWLLSQIHSRPNQIPSQMLSHWGMNESDR